MNESERRWSVGELAQATGLTIRTLYHYDEIGLVPASERTGSGHRRYTEADLRRLYRVRALRQLGFSLEEIAMVLARSTEDLTALRDLLATQLAGLELQASRITELRQQILGLLDRLDGSVMPEPEQFMATVETISLLDVYLTREQRDSLARRRAELGEDTIEALRSEWLGVVEELRRHHLAATPVNDPRVRALSERWDKIGITFQTANERADEQIRAAVNTMWRDHRAEINEQLSRRIGWQAPGDLADVIDYLQRARQARVDEGRDQ